eukprot:2863284-Amphidinium_carterae.1
MGLDHRKNQRRNIIATTSGCSCRGARRGHQAPWKQLRSAKAVAEGAEQTSTLKLNARCGYIPNSSECPTW